MQFSSLRNSHKDNSFIRGYTLLELAVGLLIMGVMLASISHVSTQYLKAEKENTTLNNESLLTSAINSYLAEKGHYPCPAPFVPRTDTADYGIAGDCTDTSVNVGECNKNGGTASDNYCVQQSDRVLYPKIPTAPGYQPADWPPSWSVNNGGQPVWPPQAWNGRVRRGEVPFRTLGIPEYETLDGYGDEFQYVVTENLAVNGRYNKDLGGIDVVNGSATVPVTATNLTGHPSLVPTPKDSSSGGAVQYILISNGPDRRGAYTQYSDLNHPVYPCPLITAPYVPSTLDAANCQITAGNWTDAIYYSAEYAPASGPSHFDDLIKYYTSTTTPLWEVSNDTSGSIHDVLNATDQQNHGKVGIDRSDLAVLNPAPDAALQVGSPNSNTVAVLAQPTIAGTGDLVTQNLCSQGSLNSNCVQADLSPTCPGGKIATGFEGSSNHLNCTDHTATTCPPNEHMYGIDANGQILCSSTLSCPNSSTWMCGNWVGITSKNVGATETVTSGYNSSKTFQCEDQNGPQWVLQSQTGSCTQCNQGSQTNNISCNQYKNWWPCGSCWSGTVQQTVTTSCNPTNVQTTYSNTGSCVCNSTSYPQNGIQCPAGFTGTYSTNQTYVCGANPSTPASGPNYSSTQSTSCFCDPTATQNQTLSCQSAGYSDGYSGHVKQTRQMQCTSANTGNWGQWTTIPNGDTCTCSNIIQYQQIGCPSPQQGTQYQQRQFDCNANSWGNWVTTSNTCASLSYQWSLSNGEMPSGTTSISQSPTLGSSCSTNGAVSPCYAPTGTGSYYSYSSCICQ